MEGPHICGAALLCAVHWTFKGVPELLLLSRHSSNIEHRHGRGELSKESLRDYARLNVPTSPYEERWPCSWWTLNTVGQISYNKNITGGGGGYWFWPSMKSPWMYAPSLGGCPKSSFIFFVTSTVRVILSSGHWFLRAILCRMAGKNTCYLCECYEALTMFLTSNCLESI